MKSKIYKPKNHSIWEFFYGDGGFARAFDTRAEARKYLKEYKNLLDGNVSRPIKFCKDY